jgi:hypothetical protein
LDRVPLRTPYTKIVEGLVTLVEELYARHVADVDVGDQVIAHPRGKGPASKVRVGLAIDEAGLARPSEASS